MDAHTFTDDTFEANVLKNPKPVLVDFWAEWCVDPNAYITRSNNLSVLAANIQEKDSLIGWREGRVEGAVSISKVASDAGHCRGVSTTSGRRIKVTDEHLFFTPSGWMRADQLKIGDRVAILPVEDPLSFKGDHTLLVSETDIEKNASQSMRVLRYIQTLKKFGLLPLYEENPKILLLARIMGAIFSDGNLYDGKNYNYREISFNLGQKEDVDAVVRDLAELGIKKVRTNYNENWGEIQGRKFLNRGYRVKCLSTALWLLLKTLGAPVGRKTDVIYHVPKWIIHADKAVKKEFLAAYLGGDGPRVRMNLVPRRHKGSYNRLHINDIEFHKREDLIPSGIEFAQDLAALLKEFGVKVNKIFSETENYTRRDDTRSGIVHLKFQHTFETGFCLAQKIGYSYCRQKQLEAMYIGEFLREIQEIKKEWKKLYRKVLSLSKKGFGYRRISRKLSIPPLRAFNWSKGRDTATSPKHHLKFPEWFIQATQGLKDGFIWETVNNIQNVFLPRVAKITVEGTHNFIANGFLAHNCQPCKIVGPTIDELAKDYEGKIAVGKMNVDENTKVPASFGIMSIPTIILFKDGKPFKSIIGVQSKDTYKKAVEEALMS